MWETQVWSLGWEDPLRRKWQPTPVLLPGKSHGWRSMVGYSPWGHKELDTTERLHFHFFTFFASGSQRIGASVSALVLPMNIQGWFSLGLTSLISLQAKGLSRVFSSTTIWKHQFLNFQPSLWSNTTDDSLAKNLELLLKVSNTDFVFLAFIAGVATSSAKFKVSCNILTFVAPKSST